VSESENDKPVLLKAIELVLADPKTIREEALSLKRKYEDRYKEDRTQEEIEERNLSMKMRQLRQQFSVAMDHLDPQLVC